MNKTELSRHLERIDEYKVVELKEVLKALGLKASGLKVELKSRLRNHISRLLLDIENEAKKSKKQKSPTPEAPTKPLRSIQQCSEEPPEQLTNENLPLIPFKSASEDSSENYPLSSPEWDDLPGPSPIEKQVSKKKKEKKKESLQQPNSWLPTDPETQSVVKKFQQAQTFSDLEAPTQHHELQPNQFSHLETPIQQHQSQQNQFSYLETPIQQHQSQPNQFSHLETPIQQHQSQPNQYSHLETPIQQHQPRSNQFSYLETPIQQHQSQQNQFSHLETPIQQHSGSDHSRSPSEPYIHPKRRTTSSSASAPVQGGGMITNGPLKTESQARSQRSARADSLKTSGPQFLSSRRNPGIRAKKWNEYYQLQSQKSICSNSSIFFVFLLLCFLALSPWIENEFLSLSMRILGSVGLCLMGLFWYHGSYSQSQLQKKHREDYEKLLEAKNDLQQWIERNRSYIGVEKKEELLQQVEMEIEEWENEFLIESALQEIQ